MRVRVLVIYLTRTRYSLHFLKEKDNLIQMQHLQLITTMYTQINSPP
jgi:hypothetical protein